MVVIFNYDNDFIFYIDKGFKCIMGGLLRLRRYVYIVFDWFVYNGIKVLFIWKLGVGFYYIVL